MWRKAVLRIAQEDLQLVGSKDVDGRSCKVRETGILHAKQQRTVAQTLGSPTPAGTGKHVATHQNTAQHLDPCSITAEDAQTTEKIDMNSDHRVVMAIIDVPVDLKTQQIKRFCKGRWYCRCLSASILPMRAASFSMFEAATWSQGVQVYRESVAGLVVNVTDNEQFSESICKRVRHRLHAVFFWLGRCDSVETIQNVSFLVGTSGRLTTLKSLTFFPAYTAEAASRHR